MKIIKVYDTIYDIDLLYKETKTKAQRALFGFMLKTGVVNNATFCGAFRILKVIEHQNANKKIYKLICDKSCTQAEERKIYTIAECALRGDLDGFAISKREISTTLKRMNSYSKGK